MGPIRLRRVFSSDFGINGAPAKQMGELEEEEGGAVTSPGKQMFFYITRRPSHDDAVSLNPGGKSTSSRLDYQRLTSKRGSVFGAPCVCVCLCDACVRACEHRKCQQSASHLKKKNLGWRMNGYATLHSSKMRTRVCTSSRQTHADARARARA